MRHLTALYLLTVADIRGTSPKVWNAWKGKLLEDLFRAAQRALTGGSVSHDQQMETRRSEALRILADRAGIRVDLQRAYALFPRLAERRAQLAGTLSGGEQQMLAIGRALMSSPKMILLDEPSLGLAPNLVREILKLIVRLRDEGITILLVEQDANAALKIADRGYVMERGAITIEGTAKELLGNDRVRQAYLGKSVA